jgi:Rha family phage regulatory protein
VDPDNRLVARTLEHDWNENLAQLNSLVEEYQKVYEQLPFTLTDEQRKRILDLAQDLPRLWHEPTTRHSQRKQLVRLLIEDGIPMTTSLEVARIFGKAHSIVLAAIRNPIIPNDFAERNFATNKIRVLNNPSGEEVESYTMTRDGFNLIAFDFTGGRAMQHKIEFIYAFDAIEAELVRIKLEGAAPQCLRSKHRHRHQDSTRCIDAVDVRCGFPLEHLTGIM